MIYTRTINGRAVSVKETHFRPEVFWIRALATDFGRNPDWDAISRSGRLLGVRPEQVRFSVAKARRWQKLAAVGVSDDELRRMACTPLARGDDEDDGYPDDDDRDAAGDKDDEGKGASKKTKKKDVGDETRRTRKEKKVKTKKIAGVLPGRDPVARVRAAARKLERWLASGRRAKPKATAASDPGARAPTGGFDLAALDGQRKIKAIVLDDPDIDLRAAHARVHQRAHAGQPTRTPEELATMGENVGAQISAALDLKGAAAARPAPVDLVTREDMDRAFLRMRGLA